MKHILQLLQFIFVALQKQNIFVNAKTEGILRGSQVGKQSVDCIPRCELPEAPAAQNQRMLKNNKKPSPSKIATGKDEKRGSSSSENSSDDKDKPTKKTEDEKKKSPSSENSSEDKDKPTKKTEDEKKKSPSSENNSEDKDKPTKKTEDEKKKSLSSEDSSDDKDKPTKRTEDEKKESPSSKSGRGARDGGDKNNKVPSTLSPVLSPTRTPTTKPAMALSSSNPVSARTKAPSSGSTEAPTAPFTTWRPSSTLISTPMFDSVISSAIEPVLESTASPTMVEVPKPVLITSSNSVVAQTMAPSNGSTETSSTLLSFESPSPIDIEESNNVQESDDSPTEAPTLSLSSVGINLASASSLTTNSNGISVVSTPFNPTYVPSSLTISAANPQSDQYPALEFDKTKFVAGEQLQPITFNMTVSKFTQIMNKEKLESYFKDFIENIVDMRSNRDWYPFNLKSVQNTTIELFPIFSMEGDYIKRRSKDVFQVQLIINGFVFVHVKGQENQQTNPISNIKPRSSFRDSFDHSMLLYLTFWGVNGVEDVLKEDGGLQDPVINSVSVGKQQLIGIDGQGNYLTYVDKDDHGNSNLRVIGLADVESSARASKCNFLSFLIISTSTAWLFM